MMNMYTISMPVTLSGIRCYVDASTTLDHHPPTPRTAGLGIFIVNSQVQPTNTIYIRACLEETHTAISAEAAVIALATALLNKMDNQQVSFLSDCAQLMASLNLQDNTDPPYWEMKIHTQLFYVSTHNTRAQVYKIDRNFNCTTNTLARLAFSSPVVQYQDYVPSCSYKHHEHQCPTSVPLVYTRV